MRLRDIDLDTGTYRDETGMLVDALSSVYMIEWYEGDPSYIEILAITKQTTPCYICNTVSEKGVTVLTNEGTVISCSNCKQISRDPMVIKEIGNGNKRTEESEEE